jgi:hypothetical protein
MSGVIAYGNSPEQVWLVAGWAFRAFLDDLSCADPTDAKYSGAIRQAEALNGLHINLLAKDDSELAKKLMKNIEQVASETLRNESDTRLNWNRGLDAEGQRMYLESIKELAAIMVNS